ncbi:MAG: hypothetical protein LBU66_07535 [Treponema sp.]|nr:hypothetical protein [Treponema sp.]
MFIPMGDGNVASVDGAARYDLGAGASLGLEYDFLSLLPNPIGLGFSIGLDGGTTTNPLLSADNRNLLAYSLGGSLGISLFPLSRLFTRIDGTAGIFQYAVGEFISSEIGFYWGFGGEVGFRFSPVFILSANAGWRQYEDAREDYNPIVSGLSAGVAAQFNIQTGGASGVASAGATALFTQDAPVYPALLQLYQTNPVGTVVIRNRENAEIRNVRLSFRASPYTSSEFFCGSIPLIQRGNEARLPLFADFSPAILRFTDSGRILGELVIRYNFLGQERVAISTVTVASHSRNAITEGEISALAAFISPTSPEILEYSKYVVGLARARTRYGHNQNMQYAIWLYEGLKASGISIGAAHTSENEALYPAETLAFGKGTSRDIGLLFAATLESVGISTAFIKIGTDYIIAVDLNMTQITAESMFSNIDRVLVIDDNAWLPVAMSSFNDGFISSWTRGVTTLNRAFERGEEIDFIMLQDAWAVYPPAPLPELGSRVGRTNSEVIQAEANRAIDQFVVQDIIPLIWRTEAQIAQNSSATLYNRLGNLLVRAGRIAEGKAGYERAAAAGSVPGMTNRGNIALNEMDYVTAEYWFRRALNIDGRNASALRGMERVEERR